MRIQEWATHTEIVFLVVVLATWGPPPTPTIDKSHYQIRQYGRGL